MSCEGCHGDQPRKGASRIKGGIRLGMAELGMGDADSETVQARRRVCEACPRWDHGKCMVCACYTWAKTLFLNEECPEDRWP